MRSTTSLAAAALLAASTGIGVVAATPAHADDAPATARAAMHSSSGTHIGWATFTDHNGGVNVELHARWVKPGFHGFHIHTIGKCDKLSAAPDDPSNTGAFLSAGGHWKMDPDSEHPNHTGDLPTIYAGEDTKVKAEFWTDRFTVADMFDEDGSAVMIHQGVDNHSNIPERYAPEGPDSDTLATGDAGSRAACGVPTR